ncbi:MAG: hypothetical protein HUJ52_04315 [Malacoplasma sp.]|nr:hypothetical protein [Malacoplasma sp.]
MKNTEYFHCFDDNELIYLFKYETNMKAKDILYEKYKNRLLSASIRYVRGYLNSLPIEICDLLSINYCNFMVALQTYDIHNQSYDFASCLFTINRSRLRKLLLYYTEHTSQKIMLNYISLNEDVEGLTSYNNAIACDGNITNTENKIAYDNVQWTVKYLLSNEGIMIRLIYTLFINGFSAKQIAKIFKIDIFKVYFVIKKLNRSVRNCNKKYW